MRKVLFVCTANVSRSPTAEDLFQGWKGVWEAKSAGITPDPRGRLLTQELIDWADLIIVMEPTHGEYITSHFQCSPDKIRILNIADRYTETTQNSKAYFGRRFHPFFRNIEGSMKPDSNPEESHGKCDFDTTLSLCDWLTFS